MKKFTSKALLDLQSAELPRATCSDVLKVSGEDSQTVLPCLNAYFSHFLPPRPKCVFCGIPLGGLEGAILGGFRWGLIHGEGTCGCGYPGRGIHYPQDEQKEDILCLELILQYHPDELIAAKTSKNAK